MKAAFPDYPAEFLEECRWYPKNLQIVDSKSKVMAFTLYDIQVRIEYEIWKAKEEERSPRLLILKARREGCTSVVTARFYRDARETPNRKSLIMNYDEPSTRNVLEMVRFFYDNDKKKQPSVKDSTAALKFENGSEFFIYTAGAGGRAGRSFAAQAILLSEPESYDDPSVLDSVLNIISEDDPALVIVIESTAKGPGGLMQSLWKDAVAGTNGFTPIFFPWHAFYKYTRPISYADLLAHAPRAFAESHRSMLTKYKEIEYALGQEVRRAASGRVGAKPGDHPGPGGRGQSKASDGKATAEKPGPRSEADGGRGSTELLQDDGRGAFGKAISVPERSLVSSGSGRDGQIPRGPESGGRIPAIHHLERLFDESLSDYERSQRIEHDLTRDQINWRRWIRDTNCQQSEVKCMHEYPGSPEEAFSISEEVVLDPFTLQRWLKEAETWPKIVGDLVIRQKKDGSIKVRWEETAIGKTTIFSMPAPGRKYVMGIDPASGMPGTKGEGDWQVACVLDTETGEQVAEFRAKMDPDIAINQVEALGIFFNEAFTACEANSIGLPWACALEDRGTLPLFEREVPDRKEPWKKTKLIGWMTSPKTRNNLMNEVRRCFREAHCPIRSLETLNECLTLWVTRTTNGQEHIEARDGCHDDGVSAYGIALMMRDRELPEEAAVDVEDVGGFELSETAKMLMQLAKAPTGPLPLNLRRSDHKKELVAKLIDGRRSVG